MRMLPAPFWICRHYHLLGFSLGLVLENVKMRSGTTYLAAELKEKEDALAAAGCNILVLSRGGRKSDPFFHSERLCPRGSPPCAALPFALLLERRRRWHLKTG